MKLFQKRLKNSYFALLYQFCCVPLLALLSFFIYGTFILGKDLGNSIFALIMLIVLIVANIALIYGISTVFIKKLKMPLIYHIIVGACTLVGVAWLNVYLSTLEAVSCASFNTNTCIYSIVNGTSATLLLIACAAYYLVYIFIHKIVQKNVEKEAIA